MIRFLLRFSAWALPAVVGVAFRSRVPWKIIMWLTGLMAVVHAVMLGAILRPGSRLLGPVIRRFPTNAREIWLTIDDGPDPEDTPVFLDLLRQHNARATFFLIGEKARKRPDLVRQILAEGHTIGNHTMTHPVQRFWRAGHTEVCREVVGASLVFIQMIGECPRLFRAPAGHTPPSLGGILAEHEILLIGWSARGFDASCTDADAILSRIARNLEPGAIVMVHEGKRDHAGNPVSPEVLRRLLELAAASDLRCIVPDPCRLVQKIRRDHRVIPAVSKADCVSTELKLS